MASHTAICLRAFGVLLSVANHGCDSPGSFSRKDFALIINAVFFVTRALPPCPGKMGHRQD
jgi:hypothetical protein